jgi:hypothetical protein
LNFLPLPTTDEFDLEVLLSLLHLCIDLRVNTKSVGGVSRRLSVKGSTEHMKRNGSWLMVALMALMVSECFAQANSAIIAGSPAVTNSQGVGINLSSATYWGGSADYLQNILQNPRSEPSTASRVIQEASGGLLQRPSAIGIIGSR